MSEWIGRNLQLNLKRTGSYLNYVGRNLPDGVCLSPLDLDRFRLYLADSKRQNLTVSERAYAERCWINVSTVYAAILDEALASPTPMNPVKVEYWSNHLLKTMLPYPIILGPHKTELSPAVRRRVCLFERGGTWIAIPRKDRI